MRERRSRLKIKVAAACTLFAVVLSLLIGGLGYTRYRTNIEESYENYIETIVAVASGMIDEERLDETIRTGKKDEAFDTLQLQLNNLKENSDAQYIYMLYYPNGVEDGTLAYVVNGYTQYELEYEADTISYLGDPAGIEDFGEDFRSQLKEGIAQNDSQIRFIDNVTQVASGLGFGAEYVKTAYMPIRDASGNLVSVLCADISMTRIYNSLQSYLVSVAVGAVVVVAVFLAIFLFVMNRQVLRPIRQIAEQADDFVQQSRRVSDPSKLHFKEIQCRTKDEVQMLAESLNHTMGELIRYMVDLKQMSAKQEKIAAEVGVAREIRLSLYPHVFPAFPERKEFDIYANLTSAGGAGGDFYNFFFTDSSHLCVMAGSVSGQGIPSTMFAAITTTVMKNFANLGYPASRVMAETNNQVSSGNLAELTAEVFFGKIDLAAGRMEYAAAGDMKPLLKTAGEEFAPLKVRSGIRLGSMENVPYIQSTAELAQGDMLFLYTSGVAETQDDKGNVYSDVYVAEQINRITGREIDLARMEKAMEEALAQFRGGKEQEKDNTMLLFRYYG